MTRDAEWNSKDGGKATVSGGLVTWKGAGVARISAKYGGKGSGDLSVTCAAATE